MRKIIFLLYILCSFQDPCFSQGKTIDSLKAELQKAKEDTTRLKLYIELGSACERKDNLLYAEPALQLADKLLSQTLPDSMKKMIREQKAGAYSLMALYYSEGTQIDLKKENEYCEKMIRLFREAKDTVNTIDIIRGLGQYYLSKGDFSRSMEYIQKGISISKEMNYKKGISLCLFQMADMYRDQGENTQALENYENALSILNEIKDTTIDLSNLLAGMAGFYYKTHNVEKSLELYRKVISIYEAKKWNDLIGWVYKWIGDLYQDNNDYTNSLLNYEKSLKMLESINNGQRFVTVLNKIGSIYNLQGNSTKALEYHLRALKKSEEIKSRDNIASSHYYLAVVYHNQKNYKSAKQYCDLALPVMKKQFDVKDISDGELLASRIDSATGNGSGAYEHYKQYVLLSYKIKAEEVHKAAQKEKFQKEFDKQKAEQEKKDAVATAELKRSKQEKYFLSAGLLMAIVFAYWDYRQKKRISEAKKAIEKEKKRSDELLLNILPSEVAEELKAKGSADAKQFDDVTVMFTDFKNFTQISEKLSPTELVNEIHTCFKAFDNIIGKHNIEKIKTIGDSYMCAGGLPVANKTHADDVVMAALEIQKFMQEHLQQRKMEGKEVFEIRIGIHTGPVVAGIVGIKKFAYDIWGDTVNIASRMEASSEAGRINLSGNTYELVKEKFRCEHRGKISAKNKGEIDMYFVNCSVGEGLLC